MIRPSRRQWIEADERHVARSGGARSLEYADNMGCPACAIGV